MHTGHLGTVLILQSTALYRDLKESSVSESTVHAGICWYIPVYTSMYQHIPIHQYILVHTGTYLYILAFTSMYWYVPAKTEIIPK